MRKDGSFYVVRYEFASMSACLPPERRGDNGREIMDVSGRTRHITDI
jgi:hypothetical protein